MSGINYGYKYRQPKIITENSKSEDGVYFSDKSNKWVVRVLNKCFNKKQRPLISIGQFEQKEDAEKYLNEYKNK